MLLNLEIGSFRSIRQTLKCPPANLIVESLGSLSVHIQGRFSTGKRWHPCIIIALSYSRVACIHDNYVSHVCTQWREREKGMFMVKVESDGNTMNILDGYTIPLAMECKTILLRQFVWVQRDILWELLPAAAKNLLAETKVPFFLTKSFQVILGYLYIHLGFSFGSIALGHLMGTKHWFWRSFYLQLSIFSAVVSIVNCGEIEAICIWWTRYLSLGVVNNELIWNP